MDPLAQWLLGNVNVQPNVSQELSTPHSPLLQVSQLHFFITYLVNSCPQSSFKWVDFTIYKSQSVCDMATKPIEMKPLMVYPLFPLCGRYTRRRSWWCGCRTVASVWLDSWKILLTFYHVAPVFPSKVHDFVSARDSSSPLRSPEFPCFKKFLPIRLVDAGVEEIT